MRWGRLSAAMVPLLTACASGGGGSSTANPPSPAASASASTPASQTLVATLVPTNASGNRITGRIRLVPSDRPGELIADIDLRGGAYQNKYAWVVRAGQCGQGTQELGTSMSYRLIETRGDGMATMKLPVRITIPEGQTHHIAIFPGPTSRDQVVACGVLSPDK